MHRQNTFEYQNVKVWLQLCCIARSTGKRLYVVDNGFGVRNI